MTPINWRLTGEEAAYIANDCDAKVFIADARFQASAEHVAANAPRAQLRVAVGGAIPGFESYEALLRGRDGTDIPDPQLGNSMLYTSGTTGKPKGVYRSSAPPTSAQPGRERRLSSRREHPSRHRSAVSRRAAVAIDGHSAAVRRGGRADGRLGRRARAGADRTPSRHAYALGADDDASAAVAARGSAQAARPVVAEVRPARRRSVSRDREARHDRVARTDRARVLRRDRRHRHARRLGDVARAARHRRPARYARSHLHPR